MELVIKIPDEVVERIKSHKYDFWDSEDARNSIRNGTPLPKGHGELKDVSQFVYECSDTYGCEAICSCYHCRKHIIRESDVDRLPTIIEAYKEDKR